MAKSFWDEEDFQQVNNGSFWDEQDFINTNNRVAQQSVSTPRESSFLSQNPSVVQSPVVEQPSGFLEGFANVVTHPIESGKALLDMAVVQPAKEFGNTLSDTAKLIHGKQYIQKEQELINNGISPQDARREVSNMAINDAKNILKSNPLMAIGASAVKGTVELPQDIQNAVADFKGSDKKWNYTGKISDAIANNKVIGDTYKDYVLSPMENNPSLSMLSEIAGAGAGALAPIKGAVKAHKLSKLEKAIKADQVAKYNAYMPKTIKAEAKAKLAQEAIDKAKYAKIHPIKNVVKKLPEDIALGAGLGLLEGKDLNERLTNAGAGTAFGVFAPFVAEGAKATVKGAGKVAKPINTKYNNWLDGTTGDSSVVASNGAGELRKFEVKTSKSGKQTLESILVDENGNTIGKQPNIQNLDALKAKYKTNNVEDIIKYEHSNKGFYDSKTDTFDVNNTDTTILESNKTAKEPNWIKNKLANTHASFNNAIGIKSSPSKLVTKYMNVDSAVARRNAPTEMKLRSDQVAEIKGYNNLSDLEAKATQVSAQTGIPIEVVLEKMYNGTWKDASTYLKENRQAKIKENVERIQNAKKQKQSIVVNDKESLKNALKGDNVIINDSETFFEDLLELEQKEAERVSKPLKNESLVSEGINTPKLEGTAVKTHELPASVNPKKSRKEKIARQQEIIEQQGGVKASEQPFNIDIKSQIEAKRRSKPRSFVVEKSGDNIYFHGEDGVSKVYGKNGKPAYVAEGARSLEKRTAGEENIYKNHEFYDNVVEDGVNKNYVKEGYHEIDASEPLYKYSQDTTPEFMKWYDEYSKADSKTKNKMLSKKLKSYKTQDEASKFYEKFSEQEMMGNQAKRARKVGDEIYDTADVSETKRLTEAIEKEDLSYEKANTEIDIQKDSKAFKNYVKKAWDGMPRGRMKNAQNYVKGVLNSCRDTATFQKEYDRFIEATQKRGFSPKVQEAMVNEINAIADSIIENKKKFGVEYKKHEAKSTDIYNNAIKELQDANTRGDLAKGKQIIERNGFKRKYIGSEAQKALDEHYTKSVERAYRDLAELGVDVVFKDGGYTATFDKARALSWAKKQVEAKLGNDNVKLEKALKQLEKNPNIAYERAKHKAQKIYDANKNIIANDIKFAYEAPQKQFKEGKLVETGDTWDRQSSDVDAGTRRAEQTAKGIENIITKEEGYTSQELTKALDDLKGKSAKEYMAMYEQYGDLLDRQYIANSGKESVPVSELPSNTYKRVKAIDEFDTIVKNNGELKAGKISNKDYAEFGTDENLKQYAKDYPDSHIITEDFNEAQTGACFDITNENMYFNLGYKGDTLKSYIAKHEFRHSQQWKDPKNQALFMDLIQKTKESHELIANNLEIWNKVKNAFNNNELVLKYKKDGSLNKHTENKITKLLGDEVAKNKFLECYNKCQEVQNHILEVDANNFAKGVDNGTIQQQIGINQGISAKQYDSRLLDAEIRNGLAKQSSSSRRNSKRKMDEANTETKSIQEEGKVVKFIENEFNKEHLPQTAQEKTKAQKAIDTNSQEFKASLARCKDAISASKLVSENTEQLYIERGMLDSEQATRALIKRGAKKKDAFYLPSGKKEIESGSIFDPAEDGTWSKENWTGGKKKFDGLNTDAKFSDVAKSNIARNLYANDVNNAVNMVRNEFAIPFKQDGTVPNGYMAVNENLLYKVAHAKGGIEMYNTMTEGGAKLKQFLGNDKKMFEQWDKLLEKDRVPDYLLPKEAVMKLLDGTGETPNQYKARYFGQGNDWRYYPKLAGAITDAHLARIKMGMLGTVKFISNNLRTSAKMSFLAGSPKDFFRAVLDRRYLRNEDIPSGVVEDAFFEAERRSRHKKLDTGIDAIDNFFNLLNGHDIDPTKYKRLVEGKDIKTNQKTTAYIDTNTSKVVEVANKLNGLNKLTINIADGLFKLNSKIEREFRKIEYAKRLNANLKDKVKHTANRMYTIREMVKAVKENPELESVIVSQIEDVYGNYHSFNQLERGVLRRIFPFYAWDRVLYRNTRFMWEKNIDKWAIAKAMMLRRQVQNDDPEKHPVLSKVLLANHKDKPLVQYQRKANRTNLYNKTTGNYLINNNTSADAYMDDLIGLPEDIPEKIYNKMNPAIKDAVNSIRGRKDYDMGFETGRYKSTYDGKYIDNKTGQKGELPLSEKAKYFAQKEIGGLIYPHSKNSIPGLVVSHARAIPHAMKTGEWRLPDKSKDVGFGGLYVGETDKYGNKVYGKNNVDYKYQLANAVATSYTNPKYDKKKQKEKWQKQSRKFRGY